ncbi:hypothetical protein EFY79_18495 [Hanamia caeni]|uniref:Uncharacterized protein n=1 Tax=Hanamia caeni TaxID=2294116 RepID=A0A3M9N734_9BACT|nr:hypothetical protein [Hanamia caeni]RNI33610.1 hypothetical protein EFY79_18495 [Hanamia caeni]
MGKKLSITQRSYDKTGWHKSSQFSTSDIKDIKISKAGNDKSLNAIPSPFARIHVFEAAFDLLDKDELNGTDYSGDTFKKLVSDCFDVFELLYNWNNHIRDEKKLSIIKWNRNTEIGNLKRSRARHKLLGETLEVFFSENAFGNFEDIFIIKYKNRPIAGSSPFTGFFTAPNAGQEIDLYNPINRGNYFSKIIPFDNRKPEIKRYILDFFYKTNLQKSDATKVIRTYLRRHAVEVADDVLIPLEEISLPDNQKIDLFGQPLQSSSRKSEIDYFEKYLVKLNYQINDSFFHIPLQQSKADRNYDYLLPLTTIFFEEFKPEDISRIVFIKELDKDSVEVLIQIGSNKISKKYHTKNVLGQDGQLIDLADSYSVKLNLGIYPFLKVVNSPDGDDYNDFYKVALVTQDLNRKYDNHDFSLEFGKNGRVIVNTSLHEIQREERTSMSKAAIGSTYYSLNTYFDFIQIALPAISNSPIKGIIVPKWQEKSIGTKKIDYSVDFGTTTTFVAYTDDPNHTKEPQALEIKAKELQLVMLNKPLRKRDDISWTEIFDWLSIKDFIESTLVQKQEFLPSIISNENKEKYKFPIRTVLFQKQSIPDNLRSLFSNTNIAFTYQREDNNLTDINQEYITNLKWNIKTNNAFKTSIKVFLQELFYLLRTKTILNEGDPKRTAITWFSPLSFTPASKQAYKEIWEDLLIKIFKGSQKRQVQNLTESEAPYYYLYKKADINDATSVLTIDIGGGSSDMMFFSENRPILGTSVHFGANILWGNGFNDFESEKANGIYEAIKEKIVNNLKSTDLKTYNEHVIAKNGSDEIINFWLLNNDKALVIDELKRNEFKLSYLLHLTSLIFHSSKLLKANNHKAPTCIIFSGNGSKYIDLIASSETIQKICGYILKSAFSDPNIAYPQVILPDANRKESTCYGGLYKPQTNNQFKPVNYLGLELNDSDYRKYIDIDIRKEYVFENVLETFNHFIDIFFKMNDEPGLAFRSNFGIEVKAQAIKSFMKSKAAENLRIGFDKRRQTVDGQDEISDSLFFYPLIGLIFKLNKLTSNEISGYSPKSIYYGLSPDNDNEFHTSRLTSIRRPDSIFSLTIQDDNPNFGELRLIEHSEVYKRAIAGIEGYLKPVSDWDQFPENGDQEIKIIKPGIVERLGDKWIVKERLKIEFI